MDTVDARVSPERPAAPLRVLMFHHAGGSAVSYLPLVRRLPAYCAPHLLELPGRGRRGAERPARNFAAAVEDLLAVATPLIDRPTLVIGHSLGAALAHGVVSRLPAARADRVRAVVVSAFTSPADAARTARHPSAPFRLWPRQRLLDELRGRGGSPPELFGEPEVLDYACTLLGHDLHLVDTYVPPDPVDLDATYHVWYGRDDPYLRIEELGRWGAATSRPPLLRGFPGGHFYLTQEAEPLDALSALVTELAGPAAASPAGAGEAATGSR